LLQKLRATPKVLVDHKLVGTRFNGGIL